MRAADKRLGKGMMGERGQRISGQREDGGGEGGEERKEKMCFSGTFLHMLSILIPFLRAVALCYINLSLSLKHTHTNTHNTLYRY